MQFFNSSAGWNQPEQQREKESIMQSPLEIEFRGMPASPALEQLIRDKAAKLEHLHGHITACSVTVESPHRHHQQGRLFQVKVRLVVPGGVLVSSHDGEGSGHEDANVAVRDAFIAIRRQLENHTRVLHGEVKAHSRPVAASTD